MISVHKKINENNNNSATAKILFEQTSFTGSRGKFLVRITLTEKINI